MNQKVITLEYDLYKDTADGEMIESTKGKNPLVFLSGSGQMIPDFESNVSDLEVGESFSFSIATENAYGKRKEEAIIELAQDMFMKDGVLIKEVVVGNVLITAALLSNQENTDIDTGAEVVAQVSHATYTAAFFDFVVKKGTNVRSGTVYACHNGDTTPLVEFTETSTNDLGDTSDVTLSVDISGTNMRLLATVTSDDWSVKSLIRAI